MGDAGDQRAHPQFLQRSRSSSSAPRACRACSSSSSSSSASPNPRLPRSKSAAKSRATTKEPNPRDHHVRNPKPTNYNAPNATTSAVVKKPSHGSPRPYPSAWALSPGRSPEPVNEAVRNDNNKKKSSADRVMGFLNISRRRKKEQSESAAAAAHELRLRGCRLLQWRFVNAKGDKAINRVQSIAERKLFFALLRINELRSKVAAMRIMIQRRKHKLKLARVLSPQARLLDQWEPLAKTHLAALSGLSSIMEAACAPLPLTDGAQADLVLLRSYISMSTEIMAEIEAAVRAFYSKAEESSTVLGELAETVSLEMEGLEELISISERIATLEMQETSLRASLIQATTKEVEPRPPPSAIRLQTWMRS